MTMKLVRDSIRKAARLLASAGAVREADAVEEFGKLLEETGDLSPAEFVAKTKQVLDGSSIGQLSVEEIVRQLRSIKGDERTFERIFEQLKTDKTIDKAKARDIAAAYLGVMLSEWKSKPKALEAIRQRFDSEAFLIAKERMNEKVTPW